MSETMSSAETTPEEAPAAEPVLSAPEAVSEAVSKAAPEAMSEATPEVAEQVAAAPNAAPAAQAEAAVTPEAHVPQAALSEPAATVEEYIAAAVEAAAPGDAVAVAESSAGVEGLPVAAESAAQTEGAPAEGAPAQGEEAAARPKRDDRRGPRGPRPDSAADAERIVRTLAVGQEIEGTVKRVSEFGAFIDIGVGRDGLVHISELSIRRVGKVTDVLNEGDKHTFWIKKLDRERNRISLTLIAPGTTTMRDLNKDDLVTGTVSRILPYGAFVDIGVGRDALLHVREMGNRFIAKPEEVVKVGEQIEARIIEIQKRRGRIDLSIKGLRDEPEAEMEAPAEQTSRGGRPRAEAQPEPEVPDIMADYEVLSPMELAFRKARRESSEDASAGQAKASAADDQRQKARLAQEEAYQRTLKQK